MYNKKVKFIDKTVKINKKQVKKGHVGRGLEKMRSRAEILKKRRENKGKKLKLINISNKEQEKEYFVSNSRLASYGIAGNQN